MHCFVTYCSTYREKNEALDQKDNDVMYLMWKDRPASGYHKVWEVYKHSVSGELLVEKHTA